jgi:hypothetical protein
MPNNDYTDRQKQEYTIADITADNALPTANEGFKVPSWSVNTHLTCRLSAGAGISTVPITWYGKLLGDGAWVPVPTAAIANLDALANDLWMFSIDAAAFERLFPYVTGSGGGPFTMKVTAVFVR